MIHARHRHRRRRAGRAGGGNGCVRGGRGQFQRGAEQQAVRIAPGECTRVAREHFARHHVARAVRVGAGKDRMQRVAERHGPVACACPGRCRLLEWIAAQRGALGRCRGGRARTRSGLRRARSHRARRCRWIQQQGVLARGGAAGPGCPQQEAQHRFAYRALGAQAKASAAARIAHHAHFQCCRYHRIDNAEPGVFVEAWHVHHQCVRIDPGTDQLGDRDLRTQRAGQVRSHRRGPQAQSVGAAAGEQQERGDGGAGDCSGHRERSPRSGIQVRAWPVVPVTSCSNRHLTPIVARPRSGVSQQVV